MFYSYKPSTWLLSLLLKINLKPSDNDRRPFYFIICKDVFHLSFVWFKIIKKIMVSLWKGLFSYIQCKERIKIQTYHLLEMNLTWAELKATLVVFSLCHFIIHHLFTGPFLCKKLQTNVYTIPPTYFRPDTAF